ncbi:MAG: conjugal transfer protein [Protaetiibacter sp.]
MKSITSSRSRVAQEAHATGIAQTMSWTGRSVLSSRLVSVVVLGALACGPFAVGVLLARGPAPQPSVVTTAPQLSVVQQSAGSYAVGFVSAWLEATRDEHQALDRYTTLQPTASLPDEPFVARDLRVASLALDETTGVASVLVAGELQQTQADPAAVPVWTLRYFQVAIATQDDELSPLSLPTPVSGPASSTSSPSLPYRYQLTTSSKAGQTITSFLAAYLAGQGTPEPYVSPSTTIEPIRPALFAQLTPLTYQVDADAPDTPAAGAEVRVLATVQGQTLTGQTLAAAYALTLRARDGRWEVAGIDAAPQLSEPSGSGTTDSSSTSESKGI